jgi:hypothetical protein
VYFPHRNIIQSLPLMLLVGIGVVMLGTRAVQLVQSKVFHVIPFGLLTKFSIVDTCVGILVSGLFMLYLGKGCRKRPMRSPLRWGSRHALACDGFACPSPSLSSLSNPRP